MAVLRKTVCRLMHPNTHRIRDLCRVVVRLLQALEPEAT